MRVLRLLETILLLTGGAALTLACSTEESPSVPDSSLPVSPVLSEFADSSVLPRWPDGLNGIWQRRGYGEVYDFSGRQMTSYAITENTCQRGIERSGLPGIADGALPLIRLKEGLADDVEVKLPGVVFPMVLTRLGQLPAQCDAAIDHDVVAGVSARQIFTLLWDNFNEYYAFFEERHVDWTALYNEFLIKVDGVDEEIFFALLTELIMPLDDGHVFISRVEESFTPALEHGVLRELESAYEVAREDVREGYLESFEDFAANALEKWGDILSSYLDASSLGNGTQMQWGTINGDIGYILINAMAGYSGASDNDSTIVADEVRIAAAEIDRALHDLFDTQKLVIDIRFNAGGFDSVALTIANRFADQRLLAIQKAARSQGQEWGHVEAWFDPVAEPYLKPVTVITGRDTASAAEVFAVAMRQLPQVTLVGERTDGALSDILVKTLPNGWEFGLSNEVYRDASGQQFEAVGVLPDVEVATFRFADLLRGRDTALDTALVSGADSYTDTASGVVVAGGSLREH